MVGENLERHSETTKGQSRARETGRWVMGITKRSKFADNFSRSLAVMIPIVGGGYFLIKEAQHTAIDTVMQARSIAVGGVNQASNEFNHTQTGKALNNISGFVQPNPTKDQCEAYLDGGTELLHHYDATSMIPEFLTTKLGVLCLSITGSDKGSHANSANQGHSTSASPPNK